MRRIALLVLVLLGCQPAVAQSPSTASPDRDAVLAVVDSFMRWVSTGDTAAVQSFRFEGATTTIAAPGPDGGTQVTRRPFDPGAPPAGPRPQLRERYWDPTVLLRGSIAVVWAPYEFWRDGKTTHCGIDVFDLVKQDGTWRVANIMYTVEPVACPELRPRDPATIRPTP
jgi:hypothetical protein